MRNLIILPFLVMVLTAGCQNVDIRKKIQERNKHSLQFFGENLVSHFPEEIIDSCWYSTTVPKIDTLEMFGFGVDKLFMIYSLSRYKTIASQLKDLPNTTYETTDSSLLLVFDYCNVIEIEGITYRDLEPLERQLLARHNVTKASSLPVPIFKIDKYKGNTISGLQEDFKLYVLDAKPGKYIDEKYLQECECLPEKWKHGYSKGVALSDERQVVIYWLIVW